MITSMQSDASPSAGVKTNLLLFWIIVKLCICLPHGVFQFKRFANAIGCLLTVSADVVWSDLHYVRVDSASEAMRVLEIGRQNLHFATTRLNHNSSRSHCIITLKLVIMTSHDTPMFARMSMYVRTTQAYYYTYFNSNTEYYNTKCTLIIELVYASLMSKSCKLIFCCLN